MPVPLTIDDLSTTASNNSPAGSESPTTTDDYLRALSAFIATLRDDKQPVDALLTALAGMATVDGQFVALTGVDTVAARNIVGTVSQSTGIPTGALVEHGSNTNGEYWRFAGGMQICMMTVATAAINEPFGSLYRSGNANFTFPVAFASIPHLSAVCDTSSMVWASALANSETGGKVNLWYAAAIAGANAAKVTAIGRWH